MKLRLAALVLLSFAISQRAADPAAGIPISIEPHGAAGQRIKWASLAGSRYVVQTSAAFGVWTDVDVVTATSGMTVWADPFPRPGTENFYRVTLPQREVTSIEPAVVSTALPTTLYFLGRCFDGTELLEINGVASGLTLILESPQRLSVVVPPLTLGLHTLELTDSLGNPIGGGLFNLPANPQGIRIEFPPPNPPAPPTPRMCSPLDIYDSMTRGKLKKDTIEPEPWLWMPKWPTPTPSGEVYYSVSDLVVPGVGLDFDWTRTYRSRLGTDTPMGVNWDFSYHIRAQKDSATSVTVFDGAGRADVFTLGAGGMFTCPERFERGALNDASTVFTLTFPDGGAWEFGAFGALPGPANLGRISAIRDRNGNALTFAYDPPTGRLATITDTLARSYTLGYAGGRIATLTDFSGRVITYTHDRAGDLVSVRSPAVVGTPNGNDFPAGKTTGYAYSSGSGDPQRDHNLLSITDGLAQTPLVFTYDTETNPANLGYDRVARVQHGSAGQEIVFSYERLTPSPANRFAAVKVYENDRLGHLTEYEYDSLNRPVRVREYTGACVVGTPVTAGANRPGAPLRVGDPALFEALYEWDADSLCTKLTMPRGNTHEWFYERDLHVAGSVPVEKRARLLLHRQRADVLGAYDQDEIVARFVYDERFGAGRGVSFPTVAMDGRGLSTLMSYDTRGNLLSVDRARNVASPASPPSGAGVIQLYDLGYNARGQLTSRRCPDNGSGHRRLDVFAYYAAGPMPGYLDTATCDSGALNLVTHYEYDATGNITRVVNPRGHDTLITRNALNQAVRVETPSVGLAGRGRTHLFYDGNNNVVRTDRANKDENGTVVAANPEFTATWTFDILNCPLTATTEIDAVATATTDFTYDPERNLTKIRWPEAVVGAQPANTIDFTHDERELPFAIVFGAGSPEQSTTRQDYDANGNLTTTIQGLEGATPRVTITVSDPFGPAPLEDFSRMLNAFGQLYGIVLSSTYIGAAPNISRYGPFLPPICGVGGDTPDPLGLPKDYQEPLDPNYDPVTGAGFSAPVAPFGGVPPAGPITNYPGTREAPSALRFLLPEPPQENGPIIVGLPEPMESCLAEQPPVASPRCVTFVDAWHAIAMIGILADMARPKFSGYLRRSGPREAMPNLPAILEGVRAGHMSGRPTSVTDPMGNITTIHYDPAGNVTSTRLDGELNDVPGSGGNVMLRFVTTTWDPLNRPLIVSDAHFNPAGGAAIGDGARTTTFEWTDFSGLEKRTDDRGNNTNWLFGTAGWLDSVTDPRGNILSCTRDANGNITQTRSTEKSDVGGSDQVFVLSRGFDERDRCASETDNVGNTCLFFHDSNSRCVATFDANGTLRRMGYDARGFAVSGFTDLDNSGALTPQDIQWGAAYDRNGRHTAATDDNAHTTATIYDALNRPVRIVSADATQHNTNYDVHHNPAQQVDQNGTQLTHTFDRNNRLTMRQVVPGLGIVPTTQQETFAHEGRGLVVSATTQGNGLLGPIMHNTAFAYDSHGNVLSETLDALTTTSSYDGVGNRTQLIHPTGRVVNFTHDALNRVSTVHDGAPVAQFFYVGPDRLARVLNGNGSQTDFAWDGVNGVANAPGDFGWRRIVRTTHVHIGSATIIDDRVFAWDRNGNKTSRNDVRPGGPQQLHQYNYDRGDRLVFTQVSSPGLGVIRQTNYALDGANNRQNVNGPGTPNPGPYVLNAGPPTFDFEQNQYTNTPIGPHQCNSTGQVTQIGGAQFFRDYAGRLVGYVPPASPPLAVYDYDALGRRVLRVLNPTGAAQTTRFGFAGAQVVSEIPGVGAPRDFLSLRVDNAVDPDEDVLTYSIRGVASIWLHHDDLGNTMAITDAAGAATERIEFQDYGVPQFFNGAGAPLGASPNGNAWLFCGWYYDTETGLYDSPTPPTSEIDWMSTRIGTGSKPETPKPETDPSNFQKAKGKPLHPAYYGPTGGSGGGFWGRIRKAFEDAKKFDPRTGRNLEVGIESVQPGQHGNGRDQTGSNPWSDEGMNFGRMDPHYGPLR